jgi:hypothetical protein
MGVKEILLADLGATLQGSIDLLICCGSFEQRSRSIPEALDPQIVRRALVAQNVDLEAYTGENAKRLRSRYQGKCFGVDIRTDDPLLTADNLGTALVELAKDDPQKCLVDITTFTHESLLILLKLLALTVELHGSTVFAYASAGEYSVGLRDHDKWLTKGVKEIRSVLGYSGDIIPSRKTHLIILVGYEHERASQLIASLGPSILSLGCGGRGTATSEKHQAANEHFRQLLRSSYALYDQCYDFDFSCCDPWEAKDAIIAQARKFSDHNVVVAPMNTKISTVGAALATQEMECIQLCYAQALRYNYQHYSEPGDKCHLFELPEITQRERMSS